MFKPPPNETVDEKRDRLARQQEAQRVSREIDEGILESKKLFDKKKKAIKVLLLGRQYPPRLERSADLDFAIIRTSRIWEIHNVEK